MKIILRIILGIPFVLFIPGYILVFALFPMKKADHGIDIIERIALSFCLSVAIVPCIGLVLNYSSWGLRMETILLSIFILILSIGIIAIYRWIKITPKERFTITFHKPLIKSTTKLDKSLNVILVVFIILIIILLVYVIVKPKTGEQFTEFYILGPEGISENYSTYLNAGEYSSVILGIVNHEGQTINYTIEVWLLNQTTVYNETAQENESIYTHMWFIDRITVILNHTPADIEKLWEPQWLYNYSFALNKIGNNLKLQFFLFKGQITENYYKYEDYREILSQKNDDAYRATHLWVSVT